MPCRLCLIAFVVVSLLPCAKPQLGHEELQSDQDLADEEDAHWGVALALLALQVGLTVQVSVAYACSVHTRICDCAHRLAAVVQA